MAFLEGHYPKTWPDYIGQEVAKYRMQVATGSALRRKKRLPHTLVYSPIAGIGKTGLGVLTAGVMKSPVLPITGAPTLDQVRMKFTELDDGDTLLYEEIHKAMDSGSKARAEWMYHYMQYGVLLTPIGVEEVPQVTIIATTTDRGRLPEPLLQRFTIQVKLEPYSVDEAAQIAMLMSQRVLGDDGMPAVSEGTARDIALAASNRPRYMESLLTTLRDLVIVGHVDEAPDGSYELDRMLHVSKFTRDGLTAEAQECLHVMFVEERARPIGVKTLANRLGELADGMRQIERLLMEKNLICRAGSRGLMLTSDGMKRAKALAQEAA